MTKNNMKENKQKKSGIPLITAAAVILCFAVAVLLIFKNSNSSGDGRNENGSGAVQVIDEGGSLIIPLSEVTSTATFYPVEVDGTRMEVIAVKDSAGNIRTAFNTCQICYGSGRGYYIQDGDALVCQNCGNRFTVDQIEIESGGCNPWPIFEDSKTVTEDSVEISYDFLKESKDIFANWKINF